jgi:hypothetical protein
MFHSHPSALVLERRLPFVDHATASNRIMNSDTDKAKFKDIASEHRGSGRDPEERPASNEAELREKMLDKTLADSFPTSDPPSSIPDPAADPEAA